jgi:hypothetical protein
MKICETDGLDVEQRDGERGWGPGSLGFRGVDGNGKRQRVPSRHLLLCLLLELTPARSFSEL